MITSNKNGIKFHNNTLDEEYLKFIQSHIVLNLLKYLLLRLFICLYLWNIKGLIIYI